MPHGDPFMAGNVATPEMVQDIVIEGRPILQGRNRPGKRLHDSAR